MMDNLGYSDLVLPGPYSETLISQNSLLHLNEKEKIASLAETQQY